MRLEVGYGLESKLTDALSSQILRQAVAPRFREGKIADGIAAGLDAIQEAIAGTYKAAPQSGAARSRSWNPAQLMLLLFVVFGLFFVFRDEFSTLLGSALDGVTKVMNVIVGA